ncbi:hypothetical protein J2P12_03150 [Candidatus Bathyarchaeota archaeon]|nr:hypothetical protein [Candidatus Bathyarchaeota archaeon]
MLLGPLLTIGTLLVPYMVWKYRLGHRQRIRVVMFASSALLGIFSILTGYTNYLTDEWATPGYVSLLLAGHDWYSVPYQFTYVRFGVVTSASIANVYLPLLPLIQVPYLDYRWFTLGLWGLLVFLVRKRYYASLAVGGPYFALMAANGFNDIIPLVFLTLAFVTLAGTPARITRYLSLGMKQFANVFVFLYYAVRRDWREAGITLTVTFLFLLPFLVWDWKSAICAPILYMPFHCENARYLTFDSVHTLINFGLWPVWAVAIYYRQLRAYFLRFDRRLYRLPTRIFSGPPRIAEQLTS